MDITVAREKWRNDDGSVDINEIFFQSERSAVNYYAEGGYNIDQFNGHPAITKVVKPKACRLTSRITHMGAKVQVCLRQEAVTA